MGVSGFLTIVVVGGIAAGAYYYRKDVKGVFASKEEKKINLEEKQYDLDRKKQSDEFWDNFWKSGQKTGQKSSLKHSPKDDPKTQKTSYTKLAKQIKSETDYQLVDGKITQNGEVVQTKGLLQSLESPKKKIAGWY